MDFTTIVLIAFGLSMDSFAVSTTSGCLVQSCKLKYKLKIALYLAFFQGLMPIIGWFLGSYFHSYIKHLDHWIAFILLLFLGSKMIFEGIKGESSKPINPLKNKTLISMGLATSIDALVIGLSFSLLDQAIWFPSLIIALITFVVSLSGIYFGIKISAKIKFKPEILGGIILIALGAKILIEHTLMN